MSHHLCAQQDKGSTSTAMSGATLAEVQANFVAQKNTVRTTIYPDTQPYFRKTNTQSIPNADGSKNCAFKAQASLESFQFDYSYSQNFPTWAQAGQCKAVQDEWNRFLDACHYHEGRHVSILKLWYQNNAPDWEKRIQSIVGYSGNCATQKEAHDAAIKDLNQKLQQAMDAAFEDLMQRERQLDIDTIDGNKDNPSMRIRTFIKCK